MAASSASNREKYRIVPLTEGASYEVQPMNPQAKKSRGRTGRIVAIYPPTGHEYNGQVLFEFDDTNRTGRLYPTDLIPLDFSEHDPPHTTVSIERGIASDEERQAVKDRYASALRKAR